MARIGLIGCSKTKLAHAAPAADLYQGQLFKLCRRWMEQRLPGRWAILSAQHGLVLPGQVLEPYDLAVSQMSRLERLAWGERVRAQLIDRWGERTIYRVLAGYDYVHALDGLPMVENPIRHWTEQRRWAGMRKPQMGIGVLTRHIKAEVAGHYTERASDVG